MGMRGATLCSVPSAQLTFGIIVHLEHTPVQRRLFHRNIPLQWGLYQELLNTQITPLVSSLEKVVFSPICPVHLWYRRTQSTTPVCTASTFHRNLPLQWGLYQELLNAQITSACQQFGVSCVQFHLPSSPLVLSYTEHTPVQHPLSIGTFLFSEDFIKSSSMPKSLRLSAVWSKLCSVPSAQFTFGIVRFGIRTNLS